MQLYGRYVLLVILYSYATTVFLYYGKGKYYVFPHIYILSVSMLVCDPCLLNFDFYRISIFCSLLRISDYMSISFVKANQDDEKEKTRKE